MKVGILGRRAGAALAPRGPAKKTVTGILKDFGWPAIDIGGIEVARLLEPLCILWVIYGIRTGTWNHAFKLLRK